MGLSIGHVQPQLRHPRQSLTLCSELGSSFPGSLLRCVYRAWWHNADCFNDTQSFCGKRAYSESRDVFHSP